MNNVVTMVRIACAAGIAAAMASCVTPGVETFDHGTIIRHVTVVDTRDGSLSRDRAVVLEGGKIVRIAADRTVRAGAGAVQVDAAGKYLVPGFLDMHTHAVPATDATPAPWPAFIAHGITGVREMAGSPELLARARRLNAERAAGTVMAPEILQMPGTLLVGVVTPAQGVQEVRRQRQMGADFIKLVSGSRDGALAVLAEARAQDLTVAGHLPPGLGAAQAADAGWRSIEHLGSGLGILLDCSTGGEDVRAALLRGEGAAPVFDHDAIISPMLYRAADAPFYQRVLSNYSEDKCRALAQTFVRAGTWHTPTLIRLRASELSNDALYRNDPKLAWVDQATRSHWQQLAAQYDANTPTWAQAVFRNYYGLQQQVVRLLKQGGVNMLAASDYGGIWEIPGYSLHQEFHELAKAGLTPLDILQMTTLNGARYLQREASMGTVEEGKLADLVLLDDNPVADAAHLDGIAAVFLNGRHFPRAELERMKRDLADALARQPAPAAAGAAAAPHVH